MKNIFRTLAIIILFLSASYNTFAQTSPVQIGVVGIPPYPTHIGDFAAGTADHIKLQLLLTDLGATRTVWLRMKMSGPSLSIQSNENVYKPTYDLTGGVPLTLGLADLAAFFNIANISGTNATQFAQPMAEGVYFICFEAFDNITNAPIGNNGCLSLLSTKNEPPMLSMPTNRAQVVEEIGSTQNAIFRWTPRHIGMGQYQYKFRIARVTDSSYTPPVWLSTFGPDYLINDVQGTMLQLNTGTYPLVAGGTYVWQVQVYGLTGTDTIDNFENSGNSEIWYFKYDQQSCTTPQAPWVTKASASTLTVHWYCNGTSSYSIRYRPSNGDKWYYAEATDSPMLLTNLKPLTEYEIGVGLACSDKGYLYGSSISVSTLHDSDTTNKVNCGIGAGTNITNQTKQGVTTIAPGQTFQATDFTVYIDHVTSTNTTDNTFTGDGHLQIKHLYFANVKVVFANIAINNSTVKQLILGKVVTTWDPAMGNIMDMGAVTRGGTHAGDVVTGDCSAGITVDIDINSPDDILVDKDHIITDADGNKTVDIKIGSQTFTSSKIPTSIVDPKGRYYGVDKNGNVKQVATTITLPDASVKALTSKIDATVGEAAFSAITDQNAPNQTIYALDNWRTEYGQSVLWMAKYEDPNITGLKVGNKCMAPGVPDVIKVTLSNIAEENKSKIKFITPKGVSFTYTRNGSDYTVNLLGGPKNDAQELYVTIDNGGGNYVSIGKLKLASYEPKTIKVAIVPVGSASLPSGITAEGLQTELNKIYNPVCINVKVRIAEKFNDNNTWDAGFNIEGSSMFSKLTPDMESLNNAFQKNCRKEEYNIFILPKFFDENHNISTTIEGDMPRATRNGYLNYSVVSSYNVAGIARLCSHELSHGTLNLKHSFDGYWPNPNQENYVTDNLLNYGTGKTFSKFQWDGMHDPAIVIGLFDSDDDGKSVKFTDITYFNAFIENGTFTFITPTGQYVTVPTDVSELVFSTFDRYVYAETNKPSETNAAMGTLLSFTLNEKTYWFTSRNPLYHNVYCYCYQDGNSYYAYEDIYSLKLKVNENKGGIAPFIYFKDNQTYDPFPIKYYISRYKSKIDIFYPNPDKKLYASTDNKAFEEETLNNFFCFNIDEAKISKTKKYKDLLIENKVSSTVKEYDNPLVISTDFQNASYFFAQGGEKQFDSRDILTSNLNSNSTFSEYILLLQFVNMKKNEFGSFQKCLEKQSHVSEFADPKNNIGKNIFEKPQFKLTLDDYHDQLDLNIIPFPTTRVGICGYIKEKLLNNFQDASVLGKYNDIKNYDITGKTTQQVYDFLKAYYPNSDCAFEAIGIELRIKMIDKLIANQSYWKDNSYYILNDIVASTPSFDRLALLKSGFMKNEYAWMQSIWDASSNDDVVILLETLMPWVIEYNDQFEFPRSPKIDININGKKITTINNTNIDTKVYSFFIGLEKTGPGNVNNRYNIEGNSQYDFLYPDASYSSSDYSFTNGKVNLNQKYIFKIDENNFGTNGIVPTFQYGVEYNSSTSPFELISIGIARVEGNDGTGLKNIEEVVAMPSFVAMFIQRGFYENHINKVASEWKKVGLWAITALTFFESGGTSVLATLSVAASRTVVANTIIDETLISQIDVSKLSVGEKQAYDLWKGYKATCEYADIGFGGAYLSKNAYRFIASGERWNGFVSSVKNLQNTGSDAGKRLQNTGKAAGRVNEFVKIDDFWAKLGDKLESVKQTFAPNTAKLNYTKEDIYLFRHKSKEASQKSNYLTDQELSKSEAKKLLALPNANTAERIVTLKIPAGTPYIEGKVNTQVNNPNGLFGNYATGGGKQYYFLDDHISLFEVMDDVLNLK